MLFLGSVVLCCWILLDMLVAKWEPTPCYHDAYSVGTPKWELGRKAGRTTVRPRFPPLFRHVFLVNKKTIFFFGGLVIWMHHIGRARHPGPGKRYFTPGQLSVEFVNLGGWSTCGDLALDSCAQFLAVAEHRLIPSRARSVGHFPRKAGPESVWAPACQDPVAGGHAGVGVVSLGGAPLSLPSFDTPEFREFFKLGRVLRTTLRSVQHFVNSSLAPVLLFRRLLKFVADILKGIRNRGFTQAWWELC